MKPLYIYLIVASLISCTRISVPVQTIEPGGSPSPYPVIKSPTSPYNQTLSITHHQTSTPIGSWTIQTPPAEVSTVTSVSQAILTVEVSGCDTSLDITHSMGEVTNAYPILKNKTPVDLTLVCFTLSASDEDRTHPNKSACIDLLPAGYQVMIKLTVDTGFQEDTAIQVDVTSFEGVTATAKVPSCLAIGIPGQTPGDAGIIIPIP